MTNNRVAGPDCAVMCNLINTHTRTNYYCVLCSVFCVLKHLGTRPFLKISSFVLIPLLLECKVQAILMYVLIVPGMYV